VTFIRQFIYPGIARLVERATTGTLPTGKCINTGSGKQLGHNLALAPP